MKISVEEIENLFDINREEGMWEQQTQLNGPWKGHARRLTSADIKDHLAGKLWVGTRPRGSTIANLGSGATCRWIVFDIDDHGPRSDRYGPVESRVLTITRILNKFTPVVFTSITGGGRHIYYRLVREVPIGRIRQALVNLCIKKDVYLAKDGTEIHPNGTPFILPFGRHQHLKQIGNVYYHVTLSGLDAFEAVRQNLNRISTINPETLIEDCS